MIAQSTPKRLTSRNQERFLEMMPGIEMLAHRAFENGDPEQLEDRIAAVVANAYVPFHRLVVQGKADVAYMTPLAMFAIRQVRDGRRVGGKLNIKDIASSYCQQRKGIRLEKLDRRDTSGNWQDVLVEDRKAGPAEIAACRIDFHAWLSRLPLQQRLIAETLAGGEATGRTARMFGLPPASISRLRRRLRQSWADFHRLPAA